ncbi:peptidoglycan DD-metalloendopeptidase family protein [Campylobacter troglodytis]|uniref:peptidoglycan DD-metalloendopeptidase family protein n=1 Tax=Campylobacter troglodytis TaxID=654363 RepID=UPI00115AA47D|nr:peptidoglycan DD-metalloendopeptidase family protein [Campylobacter troglodytis]TQR61089.1 endopeptidase [Campylobacter troglodytis]
MKKLALFCLFLSSQLFGAVQIEIKEWEKNKFFSTFLEENSLPYSLYRDLDAQEKELASEIQAGQKFHILKDENEQIEQVLIPVSNSDLQLHIYKDKEGKYLSSFSPISYDTELRFLKFSIENSAYKDIEQITGSTPLARAMTNAFAGNVDFKSMQKGDEIIVLYERKERLGERFGDIVIKMASVGANKKAKKVFAFKDSFFDLNGKEMKNFLLATPVRYSRISSYFTKARFHPILKKYRAHLGVDYAAPHGTPVKSSGNGVVSFVGTRGGYGKTVQIEHGSGYRTLYAHLSRYAKIKKGQKVSQGQTIAYVGSTGLSTGPHLHFGLYLNNVAINPLSVVKIAKSILKGKEKEDFDKLRAEYEKQTQEFISLDKLIPTKEPESIQRYIEL